MISVGQRPSPQTQGNNGSNAKVYWCSVAQPKVNCALSFSSTVSISALSQAKGQRGRERKRGVTTPFSPSFMFLFSSGPFHTSTPPSLPFLHWAAQPSSFPFFFSLSLTHSSCLVCHCLISAQPLQPLVPEKTTFLPSQHINTYTPSHTRCLPLPPLHHAPSSSSSSSPSSTSPPSPMLATPSRPPPPPRAGS